MAEDSGAQRMAADPIPGAWGEPRILLVEDSPTVQRMVAHMLEAAGAVVTVVSNGLYAIEAVRCDTFDMVLMDLEMPEMGGVEATRILRMQDEQLPIIAMTGHGGIALWETCRRAGMNDMVVKPLGPDRLRRLLRQHGPLQCIVRRGETGQAPEGARPIPMTVG
jgi:CheY-like chemotaxis protein